MLMVAHIKVNVKTRSEALLLWYNRTRPNTTIYRDGRFLMKGFMNDITTTQFEALVTMRVLYKCMSQSAMRNGFSFTDLVYKSSFIGSELLYELGLGEECQCRIMYGTRVFIIHKKNHRMIAELALSADKVANGLVKRPQFYLLQRRGFVRTQPLSRLIGEVGKLTSYTKR